MWPNDSFQQLNLKLIGGLEDKIGWPTYSKLSFFGEYVLPRTSSIFFELSSRIHKVFPACVFPFSGIAHRSSDKNDSSIAIIMGISDFEKLDVPLTSNFNKRREPLAD